MKWRPSVGAPCTANREAPSEGRPYNFVKLGHYRIWPFLAFSDIFLQLFLLRVIRFVLKELFVFGSCHVFQTHVIVNGSDAQVNFRLSDRIYSERFVHVVDRLRTFAAPQVCFTEEIVCFGRGW